MPPLSLYDILGVDRTASVDTIRRAYKRKVLATHPDKLNPKASNEAKFHAEAQFRKICEAFEILGDSQKRQAYDAQLNMKRRSQTAPSEDLLRRMKERDEWARKQEEQYRLRLEAIRERQRAEIAQKELVAKMVKEMAESLNDAIPGWLERKRKAQQMKTDRETRMKGTGQRI